MQSDKEKCTKESECIHKTFCLSLPSSVTRFGHCGKILKFLSKILRVYFVYGKILNLLWQKFKLLGNFYCWKLPNIWKKSTHLVTLLPSRQVPTLSPLGEWLIKISVLWSRYPTNQPSPTNVIERIQREEWSM